MKSFCQICGKEAKVPSKHAWQKHKIRAKEYYDRFLKKQDDGICHLTGCLNTTSFQDCSKGYLLFCCVEHAQKSAFVQDKKRMNALEKYGVDHPAKTKSVQKKTRQTYQEKYGPGITCSMQVKEYRDKVSAALKKNAQEKNDTYLNWRADVKEAWNSKTDLEISAIQKQRSDTLFEKYGVKTTMPFVQKAIKDKYGVINISQTAIWKQKFTEFWDLISEDDLKEIQRKRTETNLQRYGAPYGGTIETRKRATSKRIKTLVEQGKIIPDELLSAFAFYKRKVSYYTYRSLKQKFTVDELKQCKLCGIQGAKQVDHRYSIKQGFVDGINPEIIGSPINLELIDWLQNDKKKHRCSVTKDELIELFKQEKQNESITRAY